MHRERQWRRIGDGRGHSTIELALLVPILGFLLLTVVDFARAYRVQQRLENGTHRVALQLLANPSLPVAASIAVQAGLPPGAVTATTSYSADPNGDNHVTLTAQYDDPLILPGLRSLQTHAPTNGTLRITVQATGLARTDPPAMTSDSLLSDCSPGGTITYCLTIAPSTAGATPSGLSNLVCTVYRNGTPQALQQGCSSANPLQYGVPTSPPVWSGETFTATVMQADGVVSPPGTWSAP
jgi:Flp pilus assembly protein TadG